MGRVAEPVAIIGYACRFPGGADSPARFWDMLLAGTDAVTTLPQDRFDQARFFHPDPGFRGRSHTFACGTIGDVRGFDAEFFGISPREAREMDPQQRLLLELTYEAFESAGQSQSRMAGSDCAVYVGISGSDYGERRMGDMETMDPYFMLGSTLSIAANRISYVFDLRGPSMAIDTACSSSLVALHEAVHALQGGRSGMAVVGGVNLLLSPAPFVGFSTAMMLARDGRCRAFGKGGEGYVRAEGGGVVLLKPLDHARRDGDPILAVIRGIGANTDGRTHGIALPSSASQEALLRQVYHDARIHPRSVSYFEAHGTGTAVGDPAEASAIGRAIGQRRPRSRPLLMGSVKTNIGHLEPAAGMAGLIKAIEILRHDVVPASLHSDELNPDIAFDSLNIEVARSAVPLPGPTGPKIVGVNSFGFGGTNAHVVLESWNAARLERPADETLPFMLSAKTPEGLAALAQSVAASFAQTDPQMWHDIAYTAACRRDHHECRLVVRARNLDEARKALLAHAQGTRPRHEGALARRAKLALIFTGNGAQWTGMGTRLLREDPVFRQAISDIDDVARWRLGWSLLQMMTAPDAAMDDTRVAQPLLFALQVALVKSLQAQGLVFEGVAGHSVGEVAAAHIAGALTLEQAICVIRERSEAQARTRGNGRMMVAALGEAEARREIAAHGDRLEIAATNSPRSVTLSGPADAIRALEADLKKRSIAAKVLDLDYAFHSRAQDTTRVALLDSLSELMPAPSKLDFYSSVHGARRDGETLTAAYWWDNVRKPVHLDATVAAMESNGYRVFLEIGPLALLQGNLRHTLASGRPVPSLSKDHDGLKAVEKAIDSAYLLGAEIDFARRFPDGGCVVPFPAYPWQRQRHWYEPTSAAGLGLTTRNDAPLLGVRVAGQAAAWENLFDAAATPFFADHKVDGSIIVPAAAFVEMILEAGALQFGANAVLEIEGLEIGRPLVLETARSVRLTLLDSGFLRIESREHLGDGGWTMHVTGRLAAVSAMPDIDVAAPAADAQAVSPQAHYAFTAARGFDYGPAFQVVGGGVADERAASIALAAPDIGSYRLSPALLDGVLQAIFPVMRGHSSAGSASYVPHKIGRLFFDPAAGLGVRADVALLEGGERSVMAQGVLRAADGRPVAALEDIRLTRVPRRHQGAPPLATYTRALEPLPPLSSQAVPVDCVRAAQARLGGNVSDTDAAVLDGIAMAFAADALLGLDDDAVADAGLHSRLIGIVSSDNVQDPIELWQDAMTARPGLVAELALLGRAGLALPQKLRGFAGGTPYSAMREQLFDGAPAFEAAVHAITEAVQAFAAHWPQERQLDVLVVGAGPNAARTILARLPPQGSALSLIHPEKAAFQDLESSFAENSAVTVMRLDELVNRRFDLIAVLHVAPPADLVSLASPGALVMHARPRWSPWTSLVLEQQPPTLPPGLLDVQTITRGSAELSVAVAPQGNSGDAARDARAYLIFAGGEDIAAADALCAALANEGCAARMQDMATFVPGEAPSRLICLAGQGPLAQQATLCTDLIALIRQHSAHIAELCLVTQHALPGAPADDAKPAQALLAGIGRVLQNEMSQLGCRILDVHGATAATAPAREIVAGEEAEVILRDQGRFVSRLRPVAAPAAADGNTGAQRLVSPGGSLENLHWESFAPLPLAPDAVEIAVKAAGLNFRDVMFALGVLPDEILEGGFAGATLGMEAAGVVGRVGSAVQDLRAGDKVACFAPASLATHLTTRRFAVAKLPDGMGFAEGATLIAAFFTVTYALSHLARLRKGETILIHGAAGGVGIAALQFAKSVGADVFATAGSAEKRDFVRLMGVADDHVLDSRSTDFAAQVRALTGGKGLDVVLNSLAGEAMHRGLSLLKPFGRFIELGKVDFVANSRVGLRSFRNNISYFGVDADQLMSAQPELAAEIFRQTIALFADGTYSPLPYRIFPRDQVVDAFRHMQRARHIGKIVVETAAEPVAAAAPRNANPIRLDGAYLITGGTGGFGFATAKWLAARGARHLVLVSRSGMPAPTVAAEIAALEGQGVRVDLRACDVASEDAVAALVGAYASGLAGIVHAAAVYDDCTITDLTPARLQAVLAPKALGALALDRATRHLNLHLFLLYSSISATIGNPGQAGYVAANLALEALAARRLAEGRAAQVVALGPIADAGHLASRENLSANFGRMGVRSLKADEIFAALDEIVLGGGPGALVADVKWNRLRGLLPSLRSARFNALTGKAHADEEAGKDLDFAALRKTLEPQELLDLLLTEISQAIGKILHVAPERLDREASVFDLGMDSLMGLELRMSIEDRCGVELPSMVLAQDPSIRRISEMIRDRLTGRLDSPGSDAGEAQSEHAHILSRHGTHVAPEMIGEALEQLTVEQTRILP